LNWGVLNESVGQSLYALRKEVEQQRKEIGDLRKEVLQEQNEKAGLKVEKEEQRQEVGKLEGEMNRQDGIIARQASDIEGLKDAKKKSEDELKRSTKANEAQRRELVEEAGELTNLLKRAVLHPDPANANEIIRRIFPESKQLPPSMKKRKGKEMEIDVPDEIIAHLTRECRGNVHDRHVVGATSGSFEKQTQGANPHSGAFDNRTDCATKNVVEMETDSYFRSAYRNKDEDIQHRRNTWICYDFKKTRIVPTHYAIRTHEYGPGGPHLKWWVVETSADWESWREVAREEDNKQLSGRYFTGTFPVASGRECRFIRLVNIGRNHLGDDQLCICAWEIFASLFEYTADSSHVAFAFRPRGGPRMGPSTARYLGHT
jgi:hypothetical protein